MIDDIEKLTGGEKAQLLHADPPYGMGKEGDGVANDNLYNEDLDRFQMDWWSAFRTSLADNASAYIWGNAPDLWRLWYGGLSKSEILTLRNQIVWDKKCIPGMKSDMMRSFAVTTEHCLFFMVGEQGFNNNADNYWDGWEPLRAWLDEQRKQSGLTTDQCNKICNKKNMTQSAFTRGGFRLIAKDDYISLRDATGGAYFKRDYDDLKRDYDDLKRDYDDLKREFYESRAFFDNAHDIMRDVWEYQRVTGQERHGHVTPKPVEMMERVMRSSLPSGGLCLEPFGGSGSTLMGAEKTGRRCYTMELQPKYVDVIVRRWQDFTGKDAVHIETGKTYKELTEERLNV
jgi:DNA modification methylase